LGHKEEEHIEKKDYQVKKNAYKANAMHDTVCRTVCSTTHGEARYTVQSPTHNTMRHSVSVSLDSLVQFA